MPRLLAPSCLIPALVLAPAALAGPKEDAIQAIHQLSARPITFRGTVAAGGAGYSGPFEALIRSGTLVVSAGAGPASFSFASAGDKRVYRVTYTEAPLDPAPAAADLSRLLDLPRLEKAAAAAEWSGETAPTASLGADLCPGAESVRVTIKPDSEKLASLEFDVARRSQSAPAATHTRYTLTPIDRPGLALRTAQAELTPLVSAPPEPALTAASPQVREHARKLIAEQDADKDGKLSKSELGDRWDALKRFDQNGDGLLDESELAAAVAATLPKRPDPARRPD